VIPVWTGLAIAGLALIAVAASVRPLRRFLKLREDVRGRLTESADLLGAAQDESRAALDEAQHVFHELGMLMSGYAGRRRIATMSIRGLGFDPASAASGLIGLSNALPAYGIERLRWRAQVEHALKIQNAHGGARMQRSRLNPVLVILALVAIAFAAWTYTANRHLQHALKTEHIVRAVIEKDTKRTRERVGEAEKARLAAEQSLTEVRAQLAEAHNSQTATERALDDVGAQLTLTRKANAAAGLALEKMKDELASSESARKTSEGQLKALADELAAAKTAKDDAERGLKAANDQLAQLRAAKEDSDAAAAKAKEELERERKAREAAEQTPHAAPQPTP
jgi:hypothetical protein